VRVIAGAWGGRRLVAPAGTATRPTSDRVREALFSMLGELDGARVLDLFAGSGALGIEALSRGAAFCAFVDRDRRAIAALRANLASLEVDRGAFAVYPQTALGVLKKAGARGDAYSVVFLDPPYAESGRLAPALDELLEAVLAPGARVVSESDRRAPTELSIAVETERRYGDTLIRIHRA
jgi:16S rRNA (guanine966-N2)-methyltransferase